jgi:ATP/maltotriose-dependent transcriptional regulator MalT
MITTVKRHISNIYTKLDVKSRTQAVAIGKELKLIE